MSVHALVVSEESENFVVRACSQKVYLYANGTDKDGTFRPVVCPTRTFLNCVMHAASNLGIKVKVVEPFSILNATPAGPPKPKPTMEEIESSKAGKLYEWAREYQVEMPSTGEPLHPTAKPNFSRHPGDELRAALLEGLGYVKVSKEADPESEL
jgi:hypothetical protein